MSDEPTLGTGSDVDPSSWPMSPDDPSIPMAQMDLLMTLRTAARSAAFEPQDVLFVRGGEVGGLHGASGRADLRGDHAGDLVAHR